MENDLRKIASNARKLDYIIVGTKELYCKKCLKISRLKRRTIIEIISIVTSQLRSRSKQRNLKIFQFNKNSQKQKNIQTIKQHIQKPQLISLKKTTVQCN